MKQILFIFLMVTTSALFSQEVDTLEVHQNDTLVFDVNVSWIQRPCQDAQWLIIYKLKSPIDSTYYFIFNEEDQLIQEGLAASKDKTDPEQSVRFYHSKYLYYKKNGRLSRIYYQQNGRNFKTEFYKRGKLREVKFDPDTAFYDRSKV